jgi:hypothetical protein
MPWHTLKPARTGGGGRRKAPPAASISAGGLLLVNHAAVILLGEPERVTIQINLDEIRMRLIPLPPEATGGWSLSGGGNSQYRVMLRLLPQQYPQMIGAYTVHKTSKGIELNHVAAEEAAPPTPPP